MAALSCSAEFVFPDASAARMFQALFYYFVTVMPKAMPEMVKSVDIIRGEGEPGSIDQVNFTEASPYTYMRQRLDDFDGDNMVCKYSIIEGEILGEKLESIGFEVQFAENGTGSKCKITSSYHTKEEAEITHKEVMKINAIGMYKEMYAAVETYLAANPYLFP